MFKKRGLLSILLAMVMLVCASVTPVAAAESDPSENAVTAERAAGEVYYMGVSHYAHYTITDSNTTPYKVMGESGWLHVEGFYVKADNPSYSTVQLVGQIRDYDTGEILSRSITQNWDYPDWTAFHLRAPVHAGQRVVFYFDVQSYNNPPGPYRVAEVEYDAYLSTVN